MIECPPCGRAAESRRTGGVFCDGDEVTCECGVVLLVSYDVDDDEPYVGHWRCRHGVPDGCESCEVETVSACLEPDDDGMDKVE